MQPPHERELEAAYAVLLARFAPDTRIRPDPLAQATAWPSRSTTAASTCSTTAARSCGTSSTRSSSRASVRLPLIGRPLGRYAFSHLMRDGSRKFWGQLMVEHPERVDDPERIVGEIERFLHTSVRSDRRSRSADPAWLGRGR